VSNWLGQAFVDRWHIWSAAAGAAFVIGLGWLIRRAHHKRLLEQPLILDPPGPEEFPHKSH
jgi:hypothetical protein